MAMAKRKMQYPDKREESKKAKYFEGSTSNLNKNARSKEIGADVELSSESNDIKLLCGQPNSTEQIDFKVVPGVSDRQFYNLDSSLHDKHYILRHNHQKHYILTHTKYCFTLKEWLEKHTDNWCPIYRRWNVNRPTEEAKKLIQCILQAVYDLHIYQGIFHGFLHHPENFFIKCDPHKKIKLVHLAYENMEPKTSAKKKKESNDILAISDIIFGQILGGTHVNQYPKDLKDLYDWLSPDRHQKWKIIVDHPSLWHWKLRFNYIERVWMHYVHNENFKLTMQSCLGTIREGYDWRRKINPNTPLERVFFYKEYEETPEALVNYIRNVHVHYKERRFAIDPRTEADYLKEQFIEHKTTEVCELLLVYLHRMVCISHIEI